MKESIKYQSGAWGTIWAIVHSDVNKLTLKEMFKFLHKQNPQLKGKPTFAAMNSSLHEGGKVRDIYARTLGRRKNGQYTWKRYQGVTMPPVHGKPPPVDDVVQPVEPEWIEEQTIVEETIDFLLKLLRTALLKVLKNEE